VVAAAAAARDGFVTYDELGGLDPDAARWSRAHLPLLTGGEYVPLDPNAELIVGEGEVRVTTPRFSLSHDTFQPADRAKYLIFSTCQGEPLYHLGESPYEDFDDDFTRLRTCEITLDGQGLDVRWRRSGYSGSTNEPPRGPHRRTSCASERRLKAISMTSLGRMCGARRVQRAQVHAGEGAAYREALTLHAGGCGGHGEHRAVGRGGVHGGDAWQGHGVGADGWHVRSLRNRGLSFQKCTDTCIRNIPGSEPAGVAGDADGVDAVAAADLADRIRQ
jgi:hypothetical protein